MGAPVYNIHCTHNTEDAGFLGVWRGTYGSTVYHICVCLGIQSLWNNKIAGSMENAVKSKAGVYLPGTRVESELGSDRQDSDVSKSLTRVRAITFPHLD